MPEDRGRLRHRLPPERPHPLRAGGLRRTGGGAPDPRAPGGRLDRGQRALLRGRGAADGRLPLGVELHPHFIHSRFYCYAYVFGQLLVLALYRLFQEEGPPFIPPLRDPPGRGRQRYPAAPAGSLRGRPERRRVLAERGWMSWPAWCARRNPSPLQALSDPDLLVASLPAEGVVEAWALQHSPGVARRRGALRQAQPRTCSSQQSEQLRPGVARRSGRRCAPARCGRGRGRSRPDGACLVHVEAGVGVPAEPDVGARRRPPPGACPRRSSPCRASPAGSAPRSAQATPHSRRARPTHLGPLAGDAGPSWCPLGRTTPGADVADMAGSASSSTF